MPVIGFDDERIRDAWVDEEIRRAVWLVVHGEPVEGTLAAAMEEFRTLLREFAEAVVEAFRPMIEALSALGEAALRGMERVWEFIKGAGEEPAGKYRGPRHYSCRCLPVERVDPVKAGRTRWWARGKG